MTKAPISCGVLAAITLVWTVAAHAQDSAGRKPGTVTGLPIPQFVSLKATEVNARVGPGPDYQIAWVFKRAGLPVEVLAEFDSWRQVRDSDGVTGWVAAPLSKRPAHRHRRALDQGTYGFRADLRARQLFRGGPDRARRHCGHHGLRRRSLRGLCGPAKGLGAAKKPVGSVSRRSGEVRLMVSIPKPARHRRRA